MRIRFTITRVLIHLYYLVSERIFMRITALRLANLQSFRLASRRAVEPEPHSFFADPDRAAFLNADPDPAVFLDADPNPAVFLMQIPIQLKTLLVQN